MTRQLSLTLLALAATLWSLVMVVGGAWLCFEGAGRWTLFPPLAGRIGGLFAIASGQFLFMYLVADRWFPRASRAITWPLELVASLVLVAGVAWAAYELVRVIFVTGAA
ncbi:MAG: hypothetical protein IPJ41_08380 [Phycisphaerales bacterium]|nr:hypothetical protein [Phycisphaerales bacterium]